MNATPHPTIPSRRILPLLSLLLTPLLVSCGPTRKLEYTLDLPPTTGPLALDIENFRGDIVVRIDPRSDAVKVLAAVHSDDNDSESAHEIEVPSDSPNNPPATPNDIPPTDTPTDTSSYTLTATAGSMTPVVNVTADLIEDGPRATLRVRSTSSRPNDDDSRVLLTVTAPRCDGLRILNRRGDITAVNTAGATQITNREGFVELRTSHLMVDPVTITTTDGNIYFQAPPGSTGRFDLQSLDGQTTFIDRAGQTSEGHNTIENAYSGLLNNGTNDIVARTNRGDIRVWIIERPVALTRLFKLRLTDPRDSLFTGGSRRHTLELPLDDPRVTGPSPRAGHAFDY